MYEFSQTKSPVGKGAQTRELIVQHAWKIAEAEGLEGVTIGRVAERVGMSKSGVFAHFGAREDLLLAVLEAVTSAFTERVFKPALKLKRGLPRLKAILHNACSYYVDLPHGCVILSATHEFDDKPSIVRDAIEDYLLRLRTELIRTVQHAIDANELANDVDPEQFAFEAFGIFLSVHHELKALRDNKAILRAQRAIERLFPNTNP